jgi:hypothetical protein
MATIVQKIHAKSLGITLKVQLPPAFYLRTRIATAIMSVASLICPISVEVVGLEKRREPSFPRLPNGAPRRYGVGALDYDHEIGRKLQIYLDGVEQSEVIAYDVDAGIVSVFRKGADHRIVIEDREAVRDTLTGYVTVEWRD